MQHRVEVVPDDCIGCGLCSERAPENFEIPTGTSIAQVFKQPETSPEEEACLEACDYCPMGGVVADSAASGPTIPPAGGSTPADLAPITLED